MNRIFKFVMVLGVAFVLSAFAYADEMKSNCDQDSASYNSTLVPSPTGQIDKYHGAY